MRGERRDRTFTIPLHKLLGALNIVMISPLKHECIFIVPIGVNRANTVRLSYRCVPPSRSAGINAIRIFHILWTVGTRTRITSHNVGRFPNTFHPSSFRSVKGFPAYHQFCLTSPKTTFDEAYPSAYCFSSH